MSKGENLENPSTVNGASLTWCDRCNGRDQTQSKQLRSGCVDDPT